MTGVPTVMYVPPRKKGFPKRRDNFLWFNKKELLKPQGIADFVSWKSSTPVRRRSSSSMVAVDDSHFFGTIRDGAGGIG